MNSVREILKDRVGEGSSIRLVTHKNCMDGSTCALLMAIVFPNSSVFYVDPHKVRDKRLEDEWYAVTIFADVCPRDAVYDNEIVFDHHVSNSGVSLSEGSVMSSHRCGCAHLYDYLYTLVLERQSVMDGPMAKIVESLKKVRNLVEIVDDYDRWQKLRPMAKRVARLHEMLGQDSFVKNMYDKFCNSPQNFAGHINDWAVLSADEHKFVTLLENSDREYMDAVCQNIWKSGIDNNDGTFAVAAVAFADRSVNDICERMLHENEDAQYAVVINLMKGSVSMRSRSPEYDCSEICKKNGGGGHRQAAGFPIPKGTMDELRAVFGWDRPTEFLPLPTDIFKAISR